MNDRQWYTMLRQAYETKAAALEADGWQRRNQGEQFIEHFIKAESKIQIVRQLGDTRWYTEQYFG